MRRRHVFPCILFFLTSSTWAFTFHGTEKDPLQLQKALTQSSVVIIGWDHNRHSSVPRQIRDHIPFLGALGVRFFVAEISRDHQAELDRGDFAIVYGSRSGPRRARLLAAVRQAGISIVGGDMEESFLLLERKDLQSASPATRDWDRKWMATRNEQFAASISECLTKNPTAKVLVLVGGAHAGPIAKLLQKGYIVKVIDAESLHGDPLEEAEEVALDKMETVARWKALVDQKVESYHLEPALPLAVQRRLYATREASVIHSSERRRSEARPPEILLHELISFSQEPLPTFPPRATPEAMRVALLNKQSQAELLAEIPPIITPGTQAVVSINPHIMMRYVGYEGISGLHVFEESRLEKAHADVITVGVEDPGDRHVLLSSKRIERRKS